MFYLIYTFVFQIVLAFQNITTLKKKSQAFANKYVLTFYDLSALQQKLNNLWAWFNVSLKLQ